MSPTPVTARIQICENTRPESTSSLWFLRQTPVLLFCMHSLQTRLGLWRPYKGTSWSGGTFGTPTSLILAADMPISCIWCPILENTRSGLRKATDCRILKLPAILDSCFPVWRKEFWIYNFVRNLFRNLCCLVIWDFDNPLPIKYNIFLFYFCPALEVCFEFFHYSVHCSLIWHSWSGLFFIQQSATFLSMTHTLQKYCKWIHFIQKKIFLTCTDHLHCVRKHKTRRSPHFPSLIRWGRFRLSLLV